MDAEATGHATYDDFGPGFTLLDFGAPEHAAAIEATARSRGVALTTLRPTAPAGLYHNKLAMIDRVRGG